jgi:hypothetical protein
MPPHFILEQAVKRLKFEGFCDGGDGLLAFKRARIPY